MCEENNKIICPKCQGHGYLSYYENNQNGKCFSCNGTGYILRNQLVKYFQMSAIDLKDGQRKTFAWIKAKNENEAIKKAKKLKSKVVDWSNPQVEKNRRKMEVKLEC